MGFLGIGAMEALVILVIALIIFGPGRLPEIMGEAGKTLRDFRRATRELTGDFEESISEVRGTYREIEDEMRQTATDIRRDAKSMADDVNTAVTDITTLDETAKPKPARRARPSAKKLDQMTESEAAGDDAESRTASSKRADRPARRKEPVPASPASNGAVDGADDLLALDDGDDLLSVDDTN